MCDHSLHSDQSQPSAYLEPLRTCCGQCLRVPGSCISGNAAFTGLIWHQRFPGATLAFVNNTP
jgi:hypothetical protein